MGDMVYTRYLKFNGLPPRYSGWMKVWYKKTLNETLTPKDIVFRTRLSDPDAAALDRALKAGMNGTVTVSYTPKSSFFGSAQLIFTDTHKRDGKEVVALEDGEPLYTILDGKSEGGNTLEDESSLYEHLAELVGNDLR